jgi:nucleoside-diphosphate-sugar epimerase
MLNSYKSVRSGHGCAFLRPGENRWSNVHIDDLADVYRLALSEAPAGTFLFAENGEASLKQIATAVSSRLGFQGRTRAISAEEGIRRLGAEMAQFALASNSRVRARASRALGWRPRNDDLLGGIVSGKYPV